MTIPDPIPEVREDGRHREEGIGPMAKAMRVELEETCDVGLVCKCGSKRFRIFMDVDEASDGVSPTYINNVECDACHQLFMLRYRAAADAAQEELRQLRDEVSDLRGCIDAYRRWARECPIRER